MPSDEHARGLLAALASWFAACAAPDRPAVRPPPSAEEHGAKDANLLATTSGGRAVRHAVFGHGPRRVLVVGGIHGDEREGEVLARELPGAFLATDGAAERVTLVVIEDLNPDGSARGTRGNARGVDLNRNFPAPGFRRARAHGEEPLSEPEARALAELVTGWRPELVVVCHSWRADEFVNFDGPAQALAARFAATSGMELRASDTFAPTPGSFGSWAGVTLGIPVLTLEFRRGRTGESAWELARAALLEALLGAPAPRTDS